LFKASNMLLGPFPAGDSCNMFPVLGVHGVYAILMMLKLFIRKY